MKKALYYFLFILLFISIFSGCTGENNQISRRWKGFLTDSEGKKIRVTINFTGMEFQKGSDRMLKAVSLVIAGDNFMKNIQFKSSDGEKSSKHWIFITKSQNPAYPYGIISLSRDYKYINGQIPDPEVLSTFYSEGT